MQFSYQLDWRFQRKSELIDFHDLCDPVTATCISEKTIYVIVVSLFDFDGHPHSQYTTLDTENASLNIHGYTEIFKSLTIQHLTLNIQFSHIIEQSTFELYKMSNHCRRQLQQKTDFIIFFRISCWHRAHINWIYLIPSLSLILLSADVT